MKNQLTIKLLLIILFTVIIFHFSILFKIIPYTIAWGGRLKSDVEMYVFEFISIFINLLLVFVLCMKSGAVKQYFKPKVVNAILWVFFAFFILNTIGNLFAKTDFEKLFSILTLLFAGLIFVILRADKIKKNMNL